MYVLVADPTPDTGERSPAYLFRVSDPEGIQFIREVLPKEDGTDSVHIDFGHRLMTVTSQREDNLVKIINMDDPLKDSAVTYVRGGQSVLSAHLIDDPAYGILQSVYLAGSSNRETRQDVLMVDGLVSSKRLIGIVLTGAAKGEVVTLPIEDLRFVIGNGMSGAGSTGADTIRLRIDSGGLIGIPFGRSQISLPLSITAPSALQLDEVSDSVVTERLISITPNKEKVQDSALGFSKVYFYDRLREKWSNIQVLGTEPWVKGLGGSWIGVMTATSTLKPGAASQGESLLSLTKTQVKPVYAPSPGTAGHSQQSSGSSHSAQGRLRAMRVFAPGFLIVYNIESKERYGIETGEGDSEVLAANADLIVYRVNDSLYRVNIVGNNLSPPILLGRDKKLLNAHWAFLAAKSSEKL